MSEPFIAEIKMIGENFAPRGWAYCDGQLLPIAQNTALFSLVGTIYGGDGQTTLGLPNLQGRTPIGWGNGPGLTTRQIGQKGGEETHTLTVNEMANHSHTANASQVPANSDGPNNAAFLATPSAALVYAPDAGPQAMNAASLTSTGSGGAHDNMQPYQAVSFVIALVGVYPPRS